jgi:hypothetical protein
MAPPRGKGFYERQASAYPNGDSIRFAQEIGASFVVLHAALVTPQKVARARAANFPIWFWSGPESWSPDNWQRTYEQQMALAGRYASQGAKGFIPDIEEISWTDVEESERQALFTALRVASETYESIGFTSYPTWPYHDNIANTCPLIWASPQLYGIVTPGTGAELRARGRRWRDIFRGGYCPSLAAWDRESSEQAAYLRDFVQEEGAIFWHGLPAARRLVKAVLTAFTLVGDAPASTATIAATAPDMGTQLSSIESTVGAAAAGYANRRRQAIARLTEFIVIPDVIGTGTVAAAGSSGRDRVAAMDRSDRMQASTRADLYLAAEGQTSAVTGAMARSSSRLRMTAGRVQALPIVQEALGFDFATGEWTQQTTTSQMSGADVSGALAVREGNTGEGEVGPTGTGV